MTNRITKKHLSAALRRAHAAAVDLGIAGTGDWHVQGGNSSYRQAWHLVVNSTDSPVTTSVLGYTAREAEATLSAYAQAWEWAGHGCAVTERVTCSACGQPIHATDRMTVSVSDGHGGVRRVPGAYVHYRRSECAAWKPDQP